MYNELVDHAADGDIEFVRRTITCHNTWDNEFSFQVDPDVTVLPKNKMKEIFDAVEDEDELFLPNCALRCSVLSMMTTFSSKTYPVLYLGVNCWIDTCLTMCISV